MNKQHFNQVFNRLTVRRKEVLLKLLQNETDQAIAKSLNIEPTTVRKHRQEICEAFGLTNEFQDQRRSKLPELITLFAKYKPELLNQSSLELPQYENPTEEPKIFNNPDFVGREEAIAHLESLVGQGVKVIGIYGKGGVGKTTLAKEFLKKIGLSYWEIELPIQPQDITITFIEERLKKFLYPGFKGETKHDFMTMINELKDKLKNQKIYVLIDNLESALDAKGKFIEAHSRYVEFLRVLADRDVQSVTLITSREPLKESKVTVKNFLLPGLDEESWINFFNHHNIETKSLAFREMHKAYGGNAKAMEILCGAILQEPYNGNLEMYWQENKGNLLFENDLEYLVTSQFDRLKKTDAEAYKLIYRMGVYRYQIFPKVPKLAIMYLLWDVPEERRKRVIKSLQDRFLMELEKDGFGEIRYWLHPVIRAEAISRLKLEGELTDELILSMKKQIDKTLASDDNLQDFLTCVNRKSVLVSDEVDTEYKPVILRAYYFEIGFPFTLYKNFMRGLLGLKSSKKHPGYHIDKPLKLDSAIISVLISIGAKINGSVMDQNDNLLEIDYVRDFDVNVCANASDPNLKLFLQKLKYLLPDPAMQRELRQKWWQQNGGVWGWNMLRVVEERNLDYALHSIKLLKPFQEQQEELLRQYHEACLLLVDCLNSASEKMRSHIEDTLLLPIAEIEKRPFKN
ncbi:AAA family ATPase [Nostoc sp. HG1]|nr:AAA family ATPase [Nostoc sp. HG1]